MNRPFQRFLSSLFRTSQQRRVCRMVPISADMLEQRILLSATAGEPHDHAEEHDHTDILGNAYHALMELPDPSFEELGLEGGTGDFDGTGTLVDLSQTFFLESNPGAAHTIYLDFDGHVTSGTAWNNAFAGGADIVTAAYNFEGDSSFTDTELARIQGIWQRVAEDFLPFDVNVTTRDPGSADLAKSGTGDAAWGIRVVIGGNGSWYNSGAGGVAYVGSFNWSSDAPVFVFEDNLANGHEKYTAEATSHEIGHSLGLSHDGASGTTYYRGHGGGETGWAPIMGVGYYQNLTQWSSGEYAGATNTQDDLAIITSQNGFGYRADDIGDTAATAGSLFAMAGIVDDSGIIERSSDVDVFTFTAGAGTIAIQSNVAGRGANLDVLLELYDASGQLVATANPIDQLNASFNVSVDAGIYYLQVSGVGTGDPSTGYSDYGSIGSYRLSGSFVESNETFPSYLAISALDADRSEGNSGTTAFTFTIQRSGDISGSATVDYFVTGNEADEGDFAGGILPVGSVSFAAGESAKTITVYVQGDTAIESDESFTVTLVNASVTAEIVTDSAQGTIRNDDQPGILVSPTSGLTTSESGGTASFSVVLTHAPTADVVIAVASQNTLEGRVDTSSLVFTSSNWNVEQTVVITGVDDATRDGNQTYTVSLGTVDSGDVHYDGLDPADVEVTNVDNDKKGRKGGGGGGSTKEGKGPKRSRGAEESPSLIQTPGRSQIRSTRGNPSTVVEEQMTDEDANDVESRTSSRDKRFLDRMFMEFSDLLAELL